MSPDPRLQRLLGGEPLAPLRKRLRQRFERAPVADAVERIQLAGLNADEHAALAALTGRSPRFTHSLQIDVGDVDAALQRAGIARSLRDALEQLDGPIVHLATARDRLQTLWSSVIDGCGHPVLAALLRTPPGLGLLKRLANQEASAAQRLCRRAEAVLQRLPAQGIGRAQLAAEVLGDAHALDSGQATATLVLAVRRQLGPPLEEGEEESARDIWARAGVLVNELARPALFLNLPASGIPNHGRPAGEPVYASLRSLLRSPPAWGVAGRPVHVCENPNLLAIAADHWGPRCAPLVCTDGMPAAAQRCLLSQLAQAGAQLRYHGDFDWAGLRIGNHVMREHGARPWRFGAADYKAAVRAAATPGQPLAAGAEVSASWDEALSTSMLAEGVAIAEEAVAASLLQDLDGLAR